MSNYARLVVALPPVGGEVGSLLRRMVNGSPVLSPSYLLPDERAILPNHTGKPLDVPAFSQASIVLLSGASVFLSGASEPTAVLGTDVATLVLRLEGTPYQKGSDDMSILNPETTHNLPSETIDKLQDLLRVNIDSENGFRDAAGKVDDTALRRVFRQFADERENNAGELKQFVEINGEAAVDDGSLMAALHRTWIDLRTALSSNDSKAVLNEAERGEDHIKHMYEDVLTETAGSAVHDVLQHQYAKIKAAHDVVRDLRDTENAAS